ncbi:MAG: Beta-barrel assembly-enhancing protease [bacterium]|nr:Beta-barrel assembly-enhancing protease [bacterium]
MKTTNSIAPPGLADYHRALDLVARNRHQEAVIPLRRCLAEEPNFIDARFLLARIHRRQGRRHDAFEALGEILTAIANDGEALAEAAEIALFAGAEREALRLSEAAVKRAPRLDAARSLAVLLAFVLKGAPAAHRAVKRHLRERPTWGQGYSYLGFLEETLGRFPAAEEAYQSAVEIDPTDSVTLEHLKRLWRGELLEECALAKAYSDLFVHEARELAAAGLPVKGLEAVEEWFKRFPGRIELLEILVEACLVRGHSRKALGLIRRVPKERMSKPVLALKARALHAAGSADQAADLYRLLCLETPSETHHWVEFARSLIDSGEIEAAEETVEKALGQHPSEARLWFLRAALHKERGRADRSLADLERAVELSPRYKEALFALGVERLEQGYVEEALPPLGDVVALDPQHLEGWRHYAIAHTRARNWEEALDSWRKVRGLDPEDPQAAQNIPRISQFLGAPASPGTPAHKGGR